MTKAGTALIWMLLLPVMAGMSAAAEGKASSTKQPTRKPAAEKYTESSVPCPHFNPGQFLFLSVTGTQLDSATAAFLNKEKPTGVILMGANINDENQTRALISAIKKAEGLGQGIADLPLVGVDQEGGDVNRLHLKDAPTARELGQLADPNHTREVARAYARTCRRLGIAIIFAPVLDVFLPGANRFLETRSFGSDPDLVAQMGVSFAEGVTDEGLLPVVKHFPGHGSAMQDSHTRVAISAAKGKDLQEALYPFREAIGQARVGVMVGHIVCKELDPSGLPASVSPTVLKDVLRNQWKYEGLLITDDLNMGAMRQKRSLPVAVVQALAAGNDLALVCTGDIREAKGVCMAVAGAIKDGTLTETDLRASARRIHASQAWIRYNTMSGAEKWEALSKKLKSCCLVHKK